MKKQSGITLIALVVTIIVLLILAGVSIAMLTGDNGILNNASKTSTENAYRGAEEQVKLAFMALRTQIMAETVNDGAYDARVLSNIEVLANIVKKDLSNRSEWQIKYQGVADSDSSGEGVIYIQYKNTAIDRGIISNDDSKQVPAEEGYVHYKIFVQNQDATLELDVDTSEIPFEEFEDAGISEDESGEGSGDPNIVLTEEHIVIDDIEIKVSKNFNTWEVPQYGTNISSGLVLLSSDYYVIVRDQQYLANNDAKQSFVNNYCVKLNVEKGFTTPSTETVKGDLTLGQGEQIGQNFFEEGKVYVYTPYNDPAPQDGYTYSGWWKVVNFE